MLGKYVAQNLQNMCDGYPCGFYDSAELGKGLDIRVAVTRFVVAPRPIHLAKLKPEGVSEAS